MCLWKEGYKEGGKVVCRFSSQPALSYAMLGPVDGFDRAMPSFAQGQPTSVVLRAGSQGSGWLAGCFQQRCSAVEEPGMGRGVT